MTLNPADPSFVAHLAEALPENTLRPAEPRYLSEPRGRFHGIAGAVACPRSTQEVAVILQHAHAARVPVVPYGGGTGLVGGQVMSTGPEPLILSLERMTKFRATEPLGNVMIAEAGCVLADIQAEATRVERLFPLSLASEGSARLGGLLGTNAGGTAVLRWGNMRDLCLGLEVVTADGRIINGLKRLRKNNMGYDLRNLMIGSEGTLGVITAAALKLMPRPAQNGAALMVVRDPAAALQLLAMAQARLGEGVSGFELISGMGLQFLAQTMPQIRQPFAQPPEWMVLMDLGLVASLDPVAELEAIFADALTEGLVSDGVIAMSETQRTEFWALRESIPEANRLIGSISSHDISVPLEALPEFITKAQATVERLGPFRINCFGHLGDGNLHFNIFAPTGRERSEFENIRAELSDMVHSVVMDFDGSISAEHGIGRLKSQDLQRYGDPVGVEMMRRIKQVFDPHGILNPGAVLE